METKKLNLLILLLLIISLGGCGQKDPPPVEDPPVEVPRDTTEVPRDTTEVPRDTVEIPRDPIVMPPLLGEPMIFNKDIIGKWNLIARGPDEDNIVEIEASGIYREFLPNGVHQGYWGDSKQIYQTDSLFLYLYADHPDNNFIDKYTFINRDTLKLTYVQGNKPDIMGLPLIYIYQRIKEEELHVPLWSHVNKYISTIMDLKCFGEKIRVDDEDYSPKKEGTINGRWQLLVDFSTGDTIDYSCESIIYTFETNGKVTINSSVKDILSGTFEYDYYPDPFCPHCDPTNPRPNLVIGDNMYYCQVAPSWFITFTFIDYGDRGKARGDCERIFQRI